MVTQNEIIALRKVISFQNSGVELFYGAVEQKRTLDSLLSKHLSARRSMGGTEDFHEKTKELRYRLALSTKNHDKVFKEKDDF